METFRIIAKHPKKIPGLRSEIEDLGFTWSDSPDFIVSLGGDGTFLIAERDYPGIPKLLARDSRRCFKCHDEPLLQMLQNVKDGDYTVQEYRKLKVTINEIELLATNDVVVRNKHPGHALRFSVDDGETIIGDGLVVSTLFGATGYYHSITRSTFDSGFGIAYSNPTTKQDPEQHDEVDITIHIKRGTAQVAADNFPSVPEVEEGGSIHVQSTNDVARVIYG